MAEIFRPPLVVGRRERAPVHGLGAIVFPSLLVTTLAALVSAPFTPNACASAPQRRPAIFSDTTLDVPKTLTADAGLPFFVPPHFAPSAKRTRGVLPPDTTIDTPKPLTADRQLPFFVTPHFAARVRPARFTQPADTTRGQPVTLQVIIPAAPLVNPPHFSPLRAWFQPEDGSAGTPKALYADAQKPFFVAPHLAKLEPRDIAPPDDASQIAWASLRTPLPLPPGRVAFVAAPRWAWLNGDTTQQTPPVASGAVPPVEIQTDERRTLHVPAAARVAMVEVNVRYVLIPVSLRTMQIPSGDDEVQA